MTFTVVTTADGTLSCQDSETGEWMHNRAGAYTEALKNYVEPSKTVELAEENGEIRLLDACYGLGYNTWVLMDYLLQKVERPFTLKVVAIEMSSEILRLSTQIFEHPSFDHLNFKTHGLEHNIYYRTLRCVLDTKGEVENEFQFTIDVANGSKIELTIFIDDLRIRIPKLSGPFDLVFHDAFSAQKMPELWTVDLFQQYHRLLEKRQGKLLTYSAAAAIRGGILEAGFPYIGQTTALGAKHGGTLAGFQSAGSVLPELEMDYIKTRAGIPYRDPAFASSRDDILHRRQQEQECSGLPSGTIIRKALKQK
jgi:hypothetical protein